MCVVVFALDRSCLYQRAADIHRGEINAIENEEMNERRVLTSVRQHGYGVCVLHHRCFYTLTFSTPTVRADSSF